MTTHDCPGRCGRAVPRHLYSCRECWFRLPRTLQRAITESYRRRDHAAHLEAMAEAQRFYLDQDGGQQ